MMRSLRIGNIKLVNPLILAPMVDVTDLPYRLICRKAGASLAYTEMLNINAILHTNKKTLDLMKTSKEDHPVGVQITGHSGKYLRKVIPFLKPFDLVDINCGCPSIRTLDNKSGSFLLRSPNKIASYIKILKNAGFTATAKIRLGFKNNNILKIAKAIEKAGADAITIHARLAHDSYKVPADWKWIKKVKQNIGIPVIGNGDIFSGKQAKQMLDIADGVMIARAAIGDPLVFSRIQHYLKTGKEKPFDFKANVLLFQEYLQLARKYQVVDVLRIKFLGSNFIRNIEGASRLRNQLMQLKNLDEIEVFLRDVLKENS